MKKFNHPGRELLKAKQQEQSFCSLVVQSFAPVGSCPTKLHGKGTWKDGLEAPK